MNYKILYGNSSPMLEVNLEENETIKAESDAMVGMSTNISLDGTLGGGVMKGIGRLFSGEKLFFETLTAKGGPGHALLAPKTIGSIQPIELDGSHGFRIQKDGYFASFGDININTKAQGLGKALLSGEGLFIMSAAGCGTLFVSSYGAIHEVNIPYGEEYIVDTGHLVAWPDNMKYTIEEASSTFKSITSGEIFVCKMKGPGKIYIQTRLKSNFIPTSK